MTQNLKFVPELDQEAPTIPKELLTRSGITFNPSLTIWSYRDINKKISLDFSKLKAPLEMIFSVKRVLIWYAQNRSADHLTNMFTLLGHLFKNIEIKEKVTATDLLNYKATLNTKNYWYLTSLSGLFKRWFALNVPGVSECAIILLKQLKLKGNKKGTAVLTMDPIRGPFSELEFEAIHDAIEKAFETGEIELSDYILIWLFIATGLRPLQYAALKVCDFVVLEASESTRLA